MEEQAHAAPCTVRKVYIRGLRHTRESVVQQELSALSKARTLGAIGDVCLSASHALQSLGIFDAADMLVDASPTDGPHGPQADVVVVLGHENGLPQPEPIADQGTTGRRHAVPDDGGQEA